MEVVVMMMMMRMVEVNAGSLVSVPPRRRDAHIAYDLYAQAFE